MSDETPAFPRGMYGGSPAPPASFQRRQSGGASLAGTASVMMFIMVTLFLTMSGSFLESQGIPYQSIGGNFLVKMHPGTYVMLALLLVVTLALNPVYLLTLFMRQQPAALAYTAVTLGLFIATLLVFGPAGTSYMIDCLIVPGLFVLLFSLLEPDAQDRLFRWTLTLVAINAGIGIIEFLTKARLTPFLVTGQEQVEQYFRATALMGHPLQNALMTAIALFALPALMTDRPVQGVIYAALYAMGLVAFGGRTAMGVSAVFGVLVLTVWYIRHALTARSSYFGVLGTVMVVVGAPIALIGLWLAVGQESRIAQTFYWDTSAQSRLYALRIFDAISPADLMFGIGPGGILSQVSQLTQQTGIIGIENGWILLLLQFGLFGFVLFIVSLLIFMYRLVKGGSLSVRLCALSFLIITSSNNSLASKDSSLLLLAMVGGAAAMYERRRS